MQSLHYLENYVAEYYNYKDMDNNEFFKISSGLKSLIGAELITDIYVAIFELVKNSFDAKAQKVTITFNNLYSDNEPASITIEDDGKGMNYQDLKDKWLFVAYSAKKKMAVKILKLKIQIIGIA